MLFSRININRILPRKIWDIFNFKKSAENRSIFGLKKVIFVHVMIVTLRPYSVNRKSVHFFDLQNVFSQIHNANNQMEL